MSSKYIIADNDPDVLQMLTELEKYKFKQTDIFTVDEHNKPKFRNLTLPFQHRPNTPAITLIHATEYAGPYAVYLKEQIQKKHGDTPKKFKFNSDLCKDLFFEPVKYPSDSPELKVAHAALLQAFENCRYKDKLIFMRDLDKGANSIAVHIVDFADTLQETISIPKTLRKTFKVSFIAHFLQAFVVDEVIRNYHTIVESPEEAHQSDPGYFYLLNKAAYLVLKELDSIKGSKDDRTLSDTLYQFIIKTQTEGLLKNKVTILNVEKTIDNFFCKLLIYILERNWDTVQGILAPDGSTFPCNADNIILALEQLMPYGRFGRADQGYDGNGTRRNLMKKIKTNKRILDTVRKPE